MKILDKELKNKSIDFNKLKTFGFNKKENSYLYTKNILDNKFKVIINITNNIVTSSLIDNISNEEYTMVNIDTATGEYVGKIKEQYKSVINDFITKCTYIEIFKSKQAKLVIKYIQDKYKDNLEYLWEKFPDNAIWRNKKNNKWYGALLTVQGNKLNINSNKKIEILDLRYQKESITKIIDNQKKFAGYHMNKNNWITIKLDDTLPIKEIYKLIDNSYELSLRSK